MPKGEVIRRPGGRLNGDSEVQMEQDCSGRCTLFVTAIKPVALPGSFPQPLGWYFQPAADTRLVDGSTERVVDQTAGDAAIVLPVAGN